jgi:DNA-binding response OmpR family regulator
MSARIEGETDDPSRPLTGLRLLLVEDEALIAMQLEELIGGLGAEVIGPFGRVRDALDALRREAVSGAILDIELDGETSLAIADVLLERGAPVLFVSGGALGAVPAKYGQLPRVAKPFDEAEFLSRAISIFGGTAGGAGRPNPPT